MIGAGLIAGAAIGAIATARARGLTIPRDEPDSPVVDDVIDGFGCHNLATQRVIGKERCEPLSQPCRKIGTEKRFGSCAVGQVAQENL